MERFVIAMIIHYVGQISFKEKMNRIVCIVIYTVNWLSTQPMSMISVHILILVDFNIQMDNETDTTARDMKDLIYSFNMDQHVNHVTHKKGHLLDLVISRAENSLIRSLSVVPWAFSDHHVIKFHIPGKR